MAEYIDFETDVNGNDSGDDDVVMSDYDRDFIDDETEDNEEPSFYGFVNQTLDPKEVLSECAEEQSKLIETMEASNYQYDASFMEEEPKIIDEFDTFEKRIKNFEQTLINPIGEQNRENSLFSALVYAIRYQKNKKVDQVSDSMLDEDIGSDFYQKLLELKPLLILNIANFEQACHSTNDLPTKNGYFLRIYELKEKFRSVTHDRPQKKNIIRKVSSCIKQKFNGFNIVAVEYDRQIRKDFRPIDIIYKPVKKQHETIQCFFSSQIHLAYRSSYNKGEKIEHGNACQCYFCSNYFVVKNRFDSHIRNCSGQPGIVYDLNLQNVVSFVEISNCIC